MSGVKDIKCISPWLGLLVIALVCAVVLSAIFFKSEHSQRKHRHSGGHWREGRMKAGFAVPDMGGFGLPERKLIF